MRLLLVDDDRADAELLVEALAEAAPEVEVDVERSVEAALASMARGVPDLVLLDLNMPGQDGFDLLERVRGDARWAALPVIVWTTSAADETVRRAYSLRANAFLTKPADLHATIAALQRLSDFWFRLAVLPEAA